MNSYLKNSNYHTKILEASDGIECLNLYYQCYKKGIKILFILSDQTMNFMDGTVCCAILKNICHAKGYKVTPCYLVTAYENLDVNENMGIINVYTKPFMTVYIEEIFISLQLFDLNDK
jgi:hypothetical protein